VSVIEARAYGMAHVLVGEPETTSPGHALTAHYAENRSKVIG
jgi:hypothetical protein